MKTCSHCKVEVADHLNYCSWDCQVAEAKEAGGTVFTPNDLPISCIRADGTMLENEHGDHRDYKFPVVTEYIGPPPPPPEEQEPGILYENHPETHALIYTDGCVAITLYECCYAMWHVKDGSLGGGALWKKGEWKLSETAIAEIKRRCL